jgi:type IV secretory pathway VirB2 component (pilin)
MPRDGRREVLRLARLGRQHEDEEARRTAAAWSAAWLAEFTRGRLAALVAIATVAVVGSSVMFAAPFALGLVAEATVVIAFVMTYRNACRVNHTYNGDR